MDIKDCHNVYLIGIGGIGMSAIARYLRSIGTNVSGYDKTATSLTAELEAEGMSIVYEDDPELLPHHIDLVIYTPAIPMDHQQYNYLVEEGYPVIKRSVALGMISRSSKCIAVAGTHGKTTTSSLISTLLANCEISFSAFLGGINYDFGSNYVNFGHEWSVVEADEYDRSFLQLDPDIVVLISMDADHLDIYGDHEVMKSGFWEFILKIRQGGILVYQSALAKHFPKDWRRQLDAQRIKVIAYGIHTGDAVGKNIKVKSGKFQFTYHWNDQDIRELEIALPGRHNIENAIAAITVCRLLNCSDEVVKIGLRGFKGIYRRFERMYKDEKIIYIDDYAHHPTEVSAAILAIKELFPKRKVLGIFQPHLYTRTRDFAAGFAKALEMLDEIILMPVYPAREEPIVGVASEMILELMTSSHARVIEDRKQLLMEVAKFTEGVILTIGAGDIDLLRKPIIELLKK